MQRNTTELKMNIDEYEFKFICDQGCPTPMAKEALCRYIKSIIDYEDMMISQQKESKSSIDEIQKE
jgi:hypothetical protein